MADFNFVFKNYSDEERKIYNSAMKEIMQNIIKGMSFRKAVDNVVVDDEMLKSLIENDALKILIAELCYVSKISFEELAKMLNLPLDIIRKTNLEMLEEVQATLLQQLRPKD